MLKALIEIRWISLIVVLCSIFGALLMFIVGAVHTVEAFGVYFGFMETHIFGGKKLLGVDAMVQLVSALDTFIFGLVLFYFAFGVHQLCLKPATPDREGSETALKMPKWLEVKSLGQLKKTLLEVIIVLVAVLFLKDALYLESGTELHWTALIGPAAIVAFAIALRLVRFEEH
ncbi:MAG: YqhA family protein [Planctomycetota bacterium]|jgi:uncharacterized membrane protein YqhA